MASLNEVEARQTADMGLQNQMDVTNHLLSYESDDDDELKQISAKKEKKTKKKSKKKKGHKHGNQNS